MVVKNKSGRPYSPASIIVLSSDPSIAFLSATGPINPDGTVVFTITKVTAGSADIQAYAEGIKAANIIRVVS